MCTSLVKLNLKNNKISKVGDLDYLSMLFDLKWLNLVGNPIHDLENYKYIIKENLPDLEVLDKDEELCNMTVNVSLAAEESESENRNTNEMKTVVDFNKNINFDDNSKHNSTFNTSTYSQKLRPPSSNMSANQNILDNENANLSKTSSNFGLKNPKYLLEADTAIQGLKSMITNKRNLNPIIKKDLRQSVDKLQSNVADPFDDEVSPIMKKELVKILNDGQKRTQNYIEFKNKTYVKKEENEVKRDLKPMPIKLIRRDSSLKVIFI